MPAHYVAAVVVLAAGLITLGAGYAISTNSAEQWRASSERTSRNLASMTAERDGLAQKNGALTSQLGDTTSKLNDTTTQLNTADERIRSLANEKAQVGASAALLAELVVASQKVGSELAACIHEHQNYESFLGGSPRPYDQSSMVSRTRSVDSVCQVAGNRQRQPHPGHPRAEQVTRTALRVAASSAFVVLSLAGCPLAPVPPPSDSGTVQPASQAAAPVRTAAAPASHAPAVTAAGFSKYEKTALRVRNLGCGVSTGSGFAIADHVFVTNRHVVGGAALLQVSTYDGSDITVNAVGAFVVADLALVWTKEDLPATIQLAPLNPPTGAQVSVIGYPLGGELTTINGRVLKYGPDPIGWSSLPMIYSDASIEPGSSGSPVIDASGSLVGVAYAGGGGQSIFVPVETLVEVLKDPSRYSNGSKCEGAL
ncbi:trypsin-like peptidase domain-containing protein [Sinomonas sp. P47F7]|uniref:trypsin-like peptidase domain-containing protein n=1 Tax=Sinomonas sp. P47F7 TaxID=3410987 RepID=UPI003BF5476A